MANIYWQESPRPGQILIPIRTNGEEMTDTPKAPRDWWIIQTPMSYVIGRPSYQVADEPPSSLDQKTSVAIYHVVERSAYDALASEFRLFRLESAAHTDALSLELAEAKALLVQLRDENLHPQDMADMAAALLTRASRSDDAEKEDEYEPCEECNGLEFHLLRCSKINWPDSEKEG